LFIDHRLLEQSGDISDIQIDERFMRQAIGQAFIAEDNGDVPIGAVVVFGLKIAVALRQVVKIQEKMAQVKNVSMNLTRSNSIGENPKLFIKAYAAVIRCISLLKAIPKHL
jgi:hypothetical protein